MGNDGIHRFQSLVMGLQESIEYDKEAWLERIVAASGLSPEEFGVYYVIEEYPIEMFAGMDMTSVDMTYKITQEFHVRLKTEEEHQLEIEGEKDGSTKPD